MPVKVYSGIAPPKALLDAMATTGQATWSKPPPMTGHPVDDTDERPPVPPRPTGPAMPTSVEDVYDEAPPSYEDAMAETLSPVDGPRREYNPPDASSSSRTLNMELIRHRQYSGKRNVTPHCCTAIPQPTPRRNRLTCFLLPLRSLIPAHLPHLQLHASRVCSRHTRHSLQTRKVHLNISRLLKALLHRKTAMTGDDLNRDFVRSILEYPTESLYLGVQVRGAHKPSLS